MCICKQNARETCDYSHLFNTLDLKQYFDDYITLLLLYPSLILDPGALCNLHTTGIEYQESSAPNYKLWQP